MTAFLAFLPFALMVLWVVGWMVIALALSTI